MKIRLRLAWRLLKKFLVTLWELYKLYKILELILELLELLGLAFNYSYGWILILFQIPPQKPLWSSRFEVKEGSWVFVPNDSCFRYGRKVKEFVQSVWNQPVYYYHLCDGGHVKALHSHKNDSLFIKYDVSNFFGRINKSRVTRSLKKFLPWDQARDIATASVVRLPKSNPAKFVLPYGFVQSPILASLAISQSKLGTALERLNREPSINVSLYVDDIIISGNDEKLLKEIEAYIPTIAAESGFPINTSKSKGVSRHIVAFNVEMSHQKLSITHQRMLQFVAQYRSASSEYVREGILAYIHSVNPSQVQMLIP